MINKQKCDKNINLYKNLSQILKINKKIAKLLNF